MKAYVIAIITVSVISGIVSSLLPSGSGLKKHINFVSGLICATVLISPLISIVKGADNFAGSVSGFVNSLDISEEINKSNQIIIDTSVDKICQGVKNATVSNFNFNEDDVTVTAEINDSNIEAIILEKITVTLTGKATWTDSDKVQSYLEELVGCEIRIIKK